MQANVGSIRETAQITRLFYHETLRVFHDRLTTHDDKKYFYRMLSDIAQKNFQQVIPLVQPRDSLVFLIVLNSYWLLVE